jgi:acetylornithine deacetylase/succinyl-diaminopimelate desuccinylase-like protein
MYPFVNWAKIPTIGTGVEHSESFPHAPDENIFVSDFLEGIEHIARTILAF